MGTWWEEGGLIDGEGERGGRGGEVEKERWWMDECDQDVLYTAMRLSNNKFKRIICVGFCSSGGHSLPPLYISDKISFLVSVKPF